MVISVTTLSKEVNKISWQFLRKNSKNYVWRERSKIKTLQLASYQVWISPPPNKEQTCPL